MWRNIAFAELYVNNYVQKAFIKGLKFYNLKTFAGIKFAVTFVPPLKFFNLGLMLA